MQPPGIDPGIIGREPGEFAQTLFELASGAQPVAPFPMVHSGRHVDQRLGEQPWFAALGLPGYFEEFVAGEIPPAVEEIDSPAQSGEIHLLMVVPRRPLSVRAPA